MWPDNETDRDFLNFTGVADTVAEIIVQAQGRPISIGVSGAWGVGKSSMIRLIRKALAKRAEKDRPKFIFVEFNAEAESRMTAIEKTRDLLKRVDWLRTAKLTGSAIALAAGLPPVGIVGDL